MQRQSRLPNSPSSVSGAGAKGTSPVPVLPPGRNLQYASDQCRDPAAGSRAEGREEQEIAEGEREI